MKRIIEIGEEIYFKRTVTLEDIASFGGNAVHDVYSTFALCRDAEYTTRLFVLDVIEEDEEGVGISLSIDHLGPAFPGEEVSFRGEVTSFEKGKLLCNWEAEVGDRKVARGTTGQKIMRKSDIERLFNKQERNG